MLVPSRRNRSLIELMTDPFDVLSNVASAMPKPASLLMKTDIKETETSYELSVDLPGYRKEDVKADIKDGYLTISASKNEALEDRSDDGTYIRKERFSGTCSRSFFVGEDVVKNEIKATFKDGVLDICVPKVEVTPEVEEATSIDIEG